MSIKVKITAVTDIGKRKENQDRIAIDNIILESHQYFVEKEIFGQTFFLVLDGMGGEQYGAVASQLAVEEFVRCTKKYSIIVTKEMILEMLKNINNKISDFLRSNYAEGGTTFSLVVLNEMGYIEVYNVGDSPIIYMDEKSATVLSEDQSLAGMKLQYGMITEAEYAISKEKNILMAYLGDPTNKSLQKLYYNSYRCRQGSRIIICTDGITDVLSIQEIYKILYDEQKDITELINQVKKEPECDNMSIIDIVIQGGGLDEDSDVQTES